MDVETSRTAARSWPHIESGRRIYCVGDIHGRLDLLDGVLSRITADLAANRFEELLFLFLGDYIDRGPSSSGVIERLTALSRIVPTVFLTGNHEAVLIDFLWQPLVLPYWKTIGGYPTLLSYGVTPPLQPTDQECYQVADALQAALPDGHRDFLNSLQLLHHDGDYLFVHAGIRPGRAIDAQDQQDLLWIREAFLAVTRRHEKYIVHGHTPVQEPDLRPNRANIDTGAFATGRLTCLVVESDQLRLI